MDLASIGTTAGVGIVITIFNEARHLARSAEQRERDRAAKELQEKIAKLEALADEQRKEIAANASFARDMNNELATQVASLRGEIGLLGVQLKRFTDQLDQLDRALRPMPVLPPSRAG